MLRIQFENDSTVYEYPTQHVIDNIPAIANLSEDDLNELIIFENLDKNIFDIVLNDSYEALIEPTQTQIETIQKLFFVMKIQMMLGVNDEIKVKKVSDVVKAQLLGANDVEKEQELIEIMQQLQNFNF